MNKFLGSYKYYSVALTFYPSLNFKNIVDSICIAHYVRYRIIFNFHMNNDALFSGRYEFNDKTDSLPRSPKSPIQ